MKKIIMSIMLATGLQLAYADIPVVNVADSDTYTGSIIRGEATKNLKSLVDLVSKAKTVQGQIEALRELKNFQDNRLNSITQVDNVVKDMLNNFNKDTQNDFKSLSGLIEGLSGSKSTTAMSLKLQQASSEQLQNISTTLQKMEAENQAIIKYKQADIALKNQQEEKLKNIRKRSKEVFDRKTQNSSDAF